MSDHLICENRILEGSPLSDEDMQHLASCAACSNLQQRVLKSEQLLKASPAISPKKGFADRFWERRAQKHLEQEKAVNRKICLILGLLIGVTALSICLLALLPGNFGFFMDVFRTFLTDAVVIGGKLRKVLEMFRTPILIMGTIAFVLICTEAVLLVATGKVFREQQTHERKIRNAEK